MEPPVDAKLMKCETHFFWYDENGILCAKNYKGKIPDLNTISETVEFFKDKLNGEKACILLDFTNFTETTKEIREYINNEFPKIAKAVAMISKNPLGRMMANIFFSIRKQPYPSKLFENEKEATEWLKQYL